MKKIIALIVSAALMLSLAACSETQKTGDISEPEQTGENSQIANPMVEQENAAAFETLGIKIDAPEGAQNVAYFIIDGTLAHVVFTLDGIEYEYRASASISMGDISGVYDTFSPAFTISKVRDFDNLTAEAVKGSEGGTLVTWSADGIQYSLYTAQDASEEQVRSCVTGVLEKTFTGVVDAVSDYPGYSEFGENGNLSMDLDGDGVFETVNVTIVPEQNYSLEKRTVTVTEDSGESVSATVDIAYGLKGYATEVDGKVVLLVCGDIESCDYQTWMMRYENGELLTAQSYYEDDGTLESIPATAAGSVIGIADGIVTIENSVDLLGTWGGQTQYSIGLEPFALTRVPGSVWTRDASWLDAEYWSYCTLTTTRALPVTFDGESAVSELETGVKIGITESDYETYAKFVTEDGRTGSIAVERDDENWGWKINGVHESEYFESVPYAG